MVTTRAKMARATFYELFRNQQSAMRFTSELGCHRLAEAVAGAGKQPGSRQERIAGGIEAFLGAADRERYLSEFSLVHSQALGEPEIGPFDPRLLGTLTSLFEQAPETQSRSGRGGRVDNLIAHGIVSVVGERLRADKGESLAELAPELTKIALALHG